MKIELFIDGKKKTFTAPFVPYLAKRKYLELLAKAEKREQDPTTEEIMEEEDAMYSIMTDIIFKNQFSLEQLYEGNTVEYIKEKFHEAILGKKVDSEKGNDQGK